MDDGRPTERNEQRIWDAFFEKDSPGRMFFEEHMAWYRFAYAAFGRFVSNLYPDERNLSVLEVGCGSGLMSYACARQISALTLVDISLQALLYARSHCPGE